MAHSDRCLLDHLIAAASAGGTPAARGAVSYQRALVTGASSGIGRAFTQVLPASTDLLLVGRNAATLDEARRELDRPGRRVETIVADLADEAAVADLIARADGFGIDLLINNAGTGRLGAVIDNSARAERETAAVNVLAVVQLSRGLLPGMIDRARRERRRAGLIIVASTAAFAPVPYFTTYAASKAFDLSFAEGLAEELRTQPVDVLALCPGATRSQFGSRAGLSASNLPGAMDPQTVARQALAALGRQRVKVTGIDQAYLAPALLPRCLLTRVLGVAMREVVARMAASPTPARPARRSSPGRP
ncbi:MAG: SDR family NAD(P)-dependent oxidoreductase [Rhodospirillales bacterium]|nr:MAG: SDR family NAD(P)-dependent oxidoreductase [Rhodospirillales bacterium]